MWQAQQAWCTARGQQSSIISDLFEGQLQSSLTCSSCRATCHNFESFQDLSLPLPEEDGLTIQVLSGPLPPETAALITDLHQQHERCPEHGCGATSPRLHTAAVRMSVSSRGLLCTAPGSWPLMQPGPLSPVLQSA